MSDPNRSLGTTLDAPSGEPLIENSLHGPSTVRAMRGNRTMATALVLAALAPAIAVPAAAEAQVNGLTDGNIGLLTDKGESILKNTTIENGRLVVSMGTPAKDRQVRTWMHETQRLHWSTLVALHLPHGSKVPTTKAYSQWLGGFLSAYPQISAVEATNEPELTGIKERDAVRLYHAAKRVAKSHGVKRVLPGGFSDQPGHDLYVRRYTNRLQKDNKRLKEPNNPLWALHFYNGIVRQRPDLIKQRIKLVQAKRYWITETSSFVALGKRTYTVAEQRAQVRLVKSISKGAQRTYWTGGESCIGCQPKITAPIAQTGPPSIGPVLPYKLPPDNDKVWDGYLLQTKDGVTTLRPGLEAVLENSK